jgi:hypothetical protein
MAAHVYTSEVVTNTHTRTLERVALSRGVRGANLPTARATVGARGPHWADAMSRGPKEEPRNSYASYKNVELSERRSEQQALARSRQIQSAEQARLHPVAGHVVPKHRNTPQCRPKSAAPRDYLPAYRSRRPESVYRSSRPQPEQPLLAREAGPAARSAQHASDAEVSFEEAARRAEQARHTALLRASIPDGRMTGELLGLYNPSTMRMAATIAAESILESFHVTPDARTTQELARSILTSDPAPQPPPLASPVATTSEPHVHFAEDTRAGVSVSLEATATRPHTVQGSRLDRILTTARLQAQDRTSHDPLSGHIRVTVSQHGRRLVQPPASAIIVDSARVMRARKDSLRKKRVIARS